jgi:hypothetical protein
MLEMKIESFTNGFSVAVFDDADGYLVREVTETRLEALKAVHSVVLDLLSKEREAILDATMLQN